MKLRLLFLLFAFSTSVSAQVKCVDAVGADQVAVKDELLAKNLQKLELLLSLPDERRSDIELTEFFRQISTPAMREISNVLNNKDILSEGRLSANVAQAATKRMLKMQKDLQELGKLTAINKGIVVKGLQKIPGSVEARVQERQANVRDGHLKLLEFLQGLRSENNLLQKVGEEAQAKLAVMNEQIDLIAKLKSVLQDQAWKEEKKGQTIRLKALKETLRHADTIQSEMIQTQGVAIAFAARIDKAIDFNHQAHQQIYTLLTSEISLVQSLADRKLDLSPMGKKPSKLAEIASRWRKYAVNRWSGTKNWYRELSKTTRNTILIVALGSTAYVGHSYFEPVGNQKEAQSHSIIQRMTSKAYNVANEETLTANTRQHQNLVDEVLKLVDASSSYELKEKLISDAFNKVSYQFSPKQVAQLIEELPRQNVKGQLVGQYLNHQINNLSAETFGELLEVYYDSNVRGQFGIKFIEKAARFMSVQEVESFADEVDGYNANDQILNIYLNQNVENLSVKDANTLFDAYNSTTKANAARAQYIEANLSKLSTEEVIQIVDDITDPNLRHKLLQSKSSILDVKK